MSKAKSRVGNRQALNVQRELWKRPHKLVWPRYDETSVFSFKRKPNRRLAVISPSLVLASLGRALKPKYSFCAELFQQHWDGSIGIFFGFAFTGKKSAVYQSIILCQSEPDEKGKAPRFYFRRNVVRITAGHSQQTALAEEDIDAPDPVRLQTIELGVNADGLIAAKWDGKSLKELIAPAVNQLLKKENYCGELGLSSHCCQCILQKPRIGP